MQYLQRVRGSSLKRDLGESWVRGSSFRIHGILGSGSKILSLKKVKKLQKVKCENLGQKLFFSIVKNAGAPSVTLSVTLVLPLLVS